MGICIHAASPQVPYSMTWQHLCYQVTQLQDFTALQQQQRHQHRTTSQLQAQQLAHVPPQQQGEGSALQCAIGTVCQVLVPGMMHKRRRAARHHSTSCSQSVALLLQHCSLNIIRLGVHTPLL